MHPLETLINEEVVRVKNSGNFVVKYQIRCQIHTPTHNYGALFVTDFSLLRDYINRFSDVLSITATFAKGTIIYGILPHAKDLECTVTLTPLANVPEYVKMDNVSITEYRYKAVLYENPQDLIKANLGTANNSAVANAEDIGYLQLQLINPVQEALRTKTYGGCIRNTSGAMAILTILTHYSKVPGISPKQVVKGVDVRPGYSIEKNEHILVPHLTPLIRVPRVIEELVGGIYPTGMNYYLQGNHWYVWSPFDTTRYGKDGISMTVINVPENKLAQIEKTFRVTHNQVIILSTGKVDFKPIGDKSITDSPAAVRFVDARKILGEFGRRVGNRLIVSAKDNVNVFQDPDIAKYNRMNFAPEAETRITDNYLLEYGKLAMKKGAFLQFVWESSADNLIYPGMPVRFVYMNGKEPRQVYGTVVAVESAFQSETLGAMQRRFINKSVVSLFVNDKIDDANMQ